MYLLTLIFAVVAMVMLGTCGTLFLGSSPVVIAVAMIRRRGWVALLVLLLLAAFFGVGLYAAGRAENAAADIQQRALLLYTVLTYAMLSTPGLLMAAAHSRKWSYTYVAYAVAGLVFALLTLSVVLEWELWKTQVDGTIEEMRLAVHAQSEQFGESATTQALAWLAWLGENKAAFGFGLNYLFAIAVSCVYVTVTNFVLRRWPGESGFAGSFKDMRPTEWLVWAAIATALLCFADHRWPTMAVRIVAWNSAIALAAVYWFNGLSVLLYAVRALKPTVFTFLLVIGMTFLLVNMGALPVLALVGLFDTWGDYRRKIDALAAAQLEQEKERRGPPGTGV